MIQTPYQHKINSSKNTANSTLPVWACFADLLVRVRASENLVHDLFVAEGLESLVQTLHQDVVELTRVMLLTEVDRLTLQPGLWREENKTSAFNIWGQPIVFHSLICKKKIKQPILVFKGKPILLCSLICKEKKIKTTHSNIWGEAKSFFLS